MNGEAYSGEMARLVRWPGLGFVVLAAVLLFGACVKDDPHSPTPVVTSPSPTVQTASTGETPDEAEMPPSAAPAPSSPQLPAPIPSATPTPGRGSEAVVQPDSLIPLRLGERVRIAGTGWTVIFREVIEDSRCRPEVQCVWAGQIVVRLVGEHSDGRVAALVLTMPAGSLGSGVLGDLHIEAQIAQWLPRTTPPSPASYVLSLRADVVPPATPSALSGVRGRVTIGPMCPVVREDQPCPDRPYQAILTIRDAAGREVARVESSADGTYALSLAPGSYVMTPESPSAARLPWANPQPFEVRALLWTTLDIAFDSGIR